MGRLLYGPQEREIELEDRALAHVQAVLVSKLRRAESFTFSWASADAGRTTLWMHPSIPLQFQFDSRQPVRLNQRWLKELAEIVTRGDLRVIAEPPESPQDTNATPST